MIKHVYLFKLKDPAKAPEIAKKLMTLKERILAIHTMEVGHDFKHAENSYDLIEVCTFETMEKFLEFGADPYHEEIRQYMAGMQSEGIKIDYEL